MPDSSTPLRIFRTDVPQATNRGSKRLQLDSYRESTIPKRLCPSKSDGTRDVQAEIITGVTEDDLPIVPRGKAMTLRMAKDTIDHYKSLEVVRKLDWQQTSQWQPIRRALIENRHLIAAFVQTRGKLAQVSCHDCLNGRGVWQSCVVGSDTRYTKHNACANCRFDNRSGCSINTVKPRRRRKTSTTTSQSGYANPEPGQGLHGDGETQPNAEPTRDTSLPQTIIKHPNQHTFQSKRAQSQNIEFLSCADGKILRFPLSPSMYHNLPVLKQALEDLDRHADIIDQRIKEIKGGDENLNQINPWDVLAKKRI
ncbi:hypothetical protein BJX99DRAFT_260853 [Aspergillus californicus]